MPTERWRWVTAGVAILALAGTVLVARTIGSEFLPHLDEGALWVRATMPYTISFDESAKITPQIRDILRSFPQVTTVASELGRPDDGTDSTGFFNVEFYVGLKPYSQWTGAYRTKAELTAAMKERSRGMQASSSVPMSCCGHWAPVAWPRSGSPPAPTAPSSARWH